MKKFFAVLAVAGLMASCNSKKKDEKKPEGDTTTVTTNTTTTGDNTTTTTTTTTGVPNFKDAEVQKFANDYNTFIDQYLAGYKDPAKMAELSKSMQDWSSRAQSISMKLANDPEEAKKWTDWAMMISKKVQDAMSNMNK